MRELFVRLRDADGVNPRQPQLERAVVWRVRTDECRERVDIGFRPLLLLRHAGLLMPLRIRLTATTAAMRMTSALAMNADRIVRAFAIAPSTGFAIPSARSRKAVYAPMARPRFCGGTSRSASTPKAG